MNEAILKILTRYFKGETLSDEETALLTEWSKTSPYRDQALQSLNDKYFLRSAIRQQKEYLADADTHWEKLIDQIHGKTEPLIQQPSARLRFLRTARLWYAAAIILLAASPVLYLLATKKEPVPATVTTLAAPAAKDVAAPSLNRATLTLANGETIYLDGVTKGKIASQSKVNIQKMDGGRIVYTGSAAHGEMQFNTLTVPRGSQIAVLILSDGTKVFLNAASSLKYPIAFPGNERKVEITGEAYFEVAKDPQRKFIIAGGGVITEVLGTDFNVNAYPDEDAAKITLVDGALKVRRDDEGMIIKPGEQVQTVAQGKLQLNKHVDVSQVIAWQKGLFVFTDMTLPAILRQVSRWYNVNVKYEGNIPATSYGGGLSRSLPLSETLKLLELGNVQFALEGNTLIAKPNNNK